MDVRIQLCLINFFERNAWLGKMCEWFLTYSTFSLLSVYQLDKSMPSPSSSGGWALRGNPSCNVCLVTPTTPTMCVLQLPLWVMKKLPLDARQE